MILMASRTSPVADVAADLALSAATVRGYARSGLIPSDVTPGGHRRFSIPEVRAVLAARAAPPRPLAKAALKDKFDSASSRYTEGGLSSMEYACELDLMLRLYFYPGESLVPGEGANHARGN
jgi:hypothetical protein